MENKKIDNDDKKFQRQGWQLFVQLSGWLIGPIILALLVGQFLDQKYNTKPWLFLVCLSLAFLATCFGIVKETRRFIKSIEKQGKQ
ncbi:MAG: AtpZ/AtpI family protein [Candidatus Pacebacteria bacterium]|nr:AtpZ/AtpI family protein [Candidatus Paceibacterota bacterium]